MGQCHHKGSSLTRDAEGKGGKTRRQMASERQINILPDDPITEMLSNDVVENDLTTDQPYQPTHTPVHTLINNWRQ